MSDSSSRTEPIELTAAKLCCGSSIYHAHEWWAKRLGSVFRGILLGTMLAENDDLPKAFYQMHSFSSITVFDPFMGSGTTIGEAHKLGLTALGRDINPVAVESVFTALGPMDQHDLQIPATRGGRPWPKPC